MISFLKKNDGLLVIVGPALLILLSVVLGVVDESHYSMRLQFSALGHLIGIDQFEINRFIQGFLSGLIGLASMILINRIIANNGLLGRLSNLPLVVYALLFSIVPAEFQNPVFWISIVLVIQFVSTLVRCLLEQKLGASVFNAGFILGFLVLLSPMYVVFFLPLLAVLIINSAITLRLIIIAILGVITPVYLCYGMTYILFPGKLGSLTNHICLDVAYSMPLIGLEDLLLIALVFTAGLIESVNSRFNTMREKRLWRFEMILWVSTLCVGFTNLGGALTAIAIVPSAIILSRAMVNSKNNRVSQFLYFTLLAVVAINIGLSI